MDKPMLSINSFTEFIGSFVPEAFKKLLTEHSIESVLDVGTGVGLSLVKLHYVYETPHLEGIEIDDEHSALNAFLNEVERSAQSGWKRPRTLEELWSTAVQVDSPQTYSELRSRISLKYGVSLFDARTDLVDYDLVIASNVLHYLPINQLSNAWKKLASWLRPNARIFVSVKPDWNGRSLEEAAEMIEICTSAAAELGLEFYPVSDAKEGRQYIFTNIGLE